MPTHFGPFPGPRQTPDGHAWGPSETSHRTRTVGVSFLSSQSKLDALLPPNFELDGRPIVTVTIGYMKEINWLAGRGYNVVGVRFPAAYCGREGRVSGAFTAVVWENLADPILSGREDLGWPKLYADIPELRLNPDTGRAHGQASWDGFTFLELDLTDLQEQPVTQSGGRVGSLMLKYMPKTGNWGEADVIYPAISPAERGPRKSLAQWSANGNVRFNRATWEQLPTLVHIVNTLADLDVYEITGASMVDTLGGDDIRGQRMLR